MSVAGRELKRSQGRRGGCGGAEMWSGHTPEDEIAHAAVAPPCLLLALGSEAHVRVRLGASPREVLWGEQCDIKPRDHKPSIAAD